MSKCICGHEMKEEKAPCPFNENCTGCALCNDGIVTIVQCENEECPLQDIDLEKEVWDENEVFKQRFIDTVKDKLKSQYNLSQDEINKLVDESVFLQLIEEDPEFVVNYGVKYWVDEIYNSSKGEN